MPTVKIVQPAKEPLTLVQAKFWMREDQSSPELDAAINRLIPTARIALERGLQRTLIQSTWRYTADSFTGDCVRLINGPLVAVQSLKYIDQGGVQQLLDPAAYLVDKDASPACLVPAWGTCWPLVRCQPGAVAVEYTAGYGTEPEHVPEPLRQWIAVAVAWMIENPSEGLPDYFAWGLVNTYEVVQV